MKTSRAVCIGATLLFVASACGRSRTSSSSTAPSAEPTSCPLGVAGAQIALVDSSGAVELTLTSPTLEGAEELRWRARDAAQLYGPGAHEGFGHHGLHLGAQRHGLRLTELPPLEARVDDVNGGVHMHLAAKVSSQTDELRKKIHERVDEVRAGPCD